MSIHIARAAEQYLRRSSRRPGNALPSRRRPPPSATWCAAHPRRRCGPPAPERTFRSLPGA